MTIKKLKYGSDCTVGQIRPKTFHVEYAEMRSIQCVERALKQSEGKHPPGTKTEGSSPFKKPQNAALWGEKNQEKIV